MNGRVRPALTRAIAAQSRDRGACGARAGRPARRRLLRGSTIEALGEYGAAFALTDIASVAERDGPLQEDAITAVGRIGDPSQVNAGGAAKSAPAPGNRPSPRRCACWAARVLKRKTICVKPGLCRVKPRLPAVAARRRARLAMLP